MPHPDAPAAQKRLMEAAAHTKGGYGGVTQEGAKKWLGITDEQVARLDAAIAKLDTSEPTEEDKAIARRVAEKAHKEALKRGASPSEVVEVHKTVYEMVLRQRSKRD